MFRRAAYRLCAVERMVEEFDVLVVGAGPAGLATAIRLKQLAAAANGSNLRVGLIEKGSMIGAHILSGACIQTNALTELLPKWAEEGAPVRQHCTSDSFYLLTERSQYKCPILPSTLHNEHNYIISLGELCAWMGTKAEEMGVEIFPGFAGAKPVYSEDGSHLVGVQLGDTGINKKGELTAKYEPGMILKGKQTVLAEGCRGSLTKVLETKFKLREADNFQTYGLGVKEVWEVPPEKFKAGSITHTIGWPLTSSEGHENTYGGSFMYHYGENKVSLGFVLGLDYKNPNTRPYMELQKWKTHPLISQTLEGGTCVAYGARTLVEGGLVSQPKLSFPGGCLVGDCAGFLNLPKIKGTHAAMKSGMLAAEAIWREFYEKDPGSPPEYGKRVETYTQAYKESWLYKELYMMRNVRQMFERNFFLGVAYTGVTAMVTKGIEPWTLSHRHPDHTTLLSVDRCRPIRYPKPDGKLTFDLLTNHSRSGTNHNADQPPHLNVADKSIPPSFNFQRHGFPEGKYCPAGVYELQEVDGQKTLVINAQNCLHCKACDIKDHKQNINWQTPEGGGGPQYNAQM